MIIVELTPLKVYPFNIISPLPRTFSILSLMLPRKNIFEDEINLLFLISP